MTFTTVVLGRGCGGEMKSHSPVRRVTKEKKRERRIMLFTKRGDHPEEPYIWMIGDNIVGISITETGNIYDSRWPGKEASFST